MNLFNRLTLDRLNRMISNITFNYHQTDRNDVAHFCEHDGIYIRFTQARATWHALAPCALKPWWLFLTPNILKKNIQKNIHD